MSAFPALRLRRLRRSETLRRMVRETTLAPAQLILPYFVTHGRGVRAEVPSMPGVFQLSLDELVRDVRETAALGIPAVLLFGLPAAKDPTGSEAFAPDGIVQRAIAAIKDAAPNLVVIGDVCLCEYTDHGHCGLLRGADVDNDATLELLGRVATAQAAAGADIVAPSDMMDGRVAHLRQTLDAAGFPETAILAYAAKFASAFYGPFRDAADSAPQFGDRRGYQLDPPNAREALRELETDIAEGADLVMIKPALAYLDLLRAARETCRLPLVAYNVSGEYAMVKAAARLGWLDEQRTALEILTAIRRAGADLVITYFAKDVCRWLAS